MTELLPWHDQALRQVAAAHAAQRFSHAWLLYGSSGIGKAHFGRQLSQMLLCSNPQNTTARIMACGNCVSCRQFALNQHPDFLAPQPEEGRRVLGVDAVRALNEFAQLTRHHARHKVVLILAAEAMNTEAQNALLKTLEEPPTATILLLVTDHPARLLPTIRSRCQKLPFAAPTREQALQWLKSQGQTEPDAALDSAGGAPLRALHAAGQERITELRQWGADLGDLLTGRKSPISLAEQFSDPGRAAAFQQWLEQECRRYLRHALLQRPTQGVFSSLNIAGLLHLSRLLQELARIQDRSLRWNWQLAGLLYELQNLTQAGTGRAA